MTTLALVHGAYHGAWCWDRVIPLLTARGIDVVAPELPCEDPAAGIAEYATIVEAALDGRDDVVIVGHSLGGLTIPVVASHRPIRRMVFLCSVPTGPGPAVAGAMAEMVTEEFLTAPRFTNDQGVELLSNRPAAGSSSTTAATSTPTGPSPACGPRPPDRRVNPHP